jgi:4-hydroxy-tetrahydrodipicolinate synthase
MKTFEGSMVALATPFKNGAFDEAAYRDFILFQLDEGTEGLVPIGTTGEAVTMTAPERAQAVKVAVETAGKKVPVIAGAGSNNTQEAIDSVRRARELGADGALVVTPYYNKPTQAGLVEHYRAIARANSGFPLMAYNVPSRTNVDLLPETCARLCEIPEVMGIKEATGNMARVMDIRERCGDRLILISGDDLTVLPFIACGGKGVISVSANVAPRMMADLVRAARGGDLKKGQELQLRMNALHRLLFVETSPSPVKWALHRMGKMGSELRLPLVPMTEPNAAKLEAEMKHLGLL